MNISRVGLCLLSTMAAGAAVVPNVLDAPAAEAAVTITLDGAGR